MRVNKRGLALIAALVWVATTSTGMRGQATPPPPILLVVNAAASNPFGPYLGEILRAEGIPSFSTVQLASLDAATLANAKLTILAETTLSQTQAALFANYVSSGGRLVAMHPDAQLAPTLGIQQTAGVTTDGYLAIDQSGPGVGLQAMTLPFRGAARQYTLSSGATAVAALYSNQTTQTPYPAVVKHGRTATWAFDLARSVAYTRQGDPALAGLDRDNQPIYRTNDIFFEDLDLDRVSVPHADVQMRLFSRVIADLLADSQPLPKLWYFPGTHRTILLPTGDSHTTSAEPYDSLLATAEAHGARMSIYPGRYITYPTPGVLADWRAIGHELGAHPYFSPDGVDMEGGYQIAESWFAQAGWAPTSRTTRHHSLEWEGWVGPVAVMANHGIRLDSSYYAWGPALEYDGDKTHQAHGYINGSGLPMRFVNQVGTILPVYQQVTALTDEQLITGSWAQGLSPEAALEVTREIIDNSQAGGYSAVMTQFHVDYYLWGEVRPWVDGTFAYAASLGLPMWTAERWLEFVEARAATSIDNQSWSANGKRLTFTITVPDGAEPQSLTLPATFAGDPLTVATLGGQVVAPDSLTINGQVTRVISVAPLPGGGPRNVLVRYGNAPQPPPAVTINDVSVFEGNQGTTYATLTVSLSEPAASPITVSYATVNGTATAGQDYVAGSGTLTFGTGVAAQTIPVAILGDTTVEPDESIQVVLSNPQGAELADALGIVIILNDDQPPPPTNTPPVAANDAATTITGSPVSVAVLANDSDVDGDALSVVAVSGGTLGTPTIAAGGVAVTYTPAGTQCGTDTVSYTVSDGRGGVATASVTVTISCTGTTTTHTTVTDFSACPDVALAGTRVGAAGDVRLGGTVGDEFSGSTLGSGWVSGTWAGGSVTPAPAGGVLSLGHAQGIFVRSSATVPVSGLDARVRFAAAPWQHVGWASLDFSGPYIIFSTFNGSSRLYARTNVGTGGEIRTDLGPLPTDYRNYRIERIAQGATDLIRYTIDGAVVAEHVVATSSSPLHVYLSHNGGATPTLDVDRVAVDAPYTASGTYQSCVIDAGAPVDWGSIAWTSAVPSGTTLAVRTRTSATLQTWSAWSSPAVTNGAAVTSPAGRYLQYQLALTSTNPALSPVVDSVTVTDTSAPEVPTLAINSVGLPEGQNGVASAVFTVTLSGAAAAPVSVDYATANGTATAGQDYMATSGTLTFQPGDTSRLLPVSVLGDTVVEPDETFSVVLSNPVNAQLAVATGTGTIVNDDVAQPTNTPPVAVNDSATAIQGQTVVIAVLGNDSDPDNDPLTVTGVTGATLGTAIVGGNAQTVIYTAPQSQCGVDQLTYAIADGRGGTATASVSVTVGCSGVSFGHLTASDFSTCSTASGTQVTTLGDGEVRLGSTLTDEFTGTTLASRWVAGSWSGGAYTPSLASGVLSLGNAGGAFVRSVDAVPLSLLSARVQFAALPWQHVGYAALDFAGPYAIVSTFNGSTNLYARTYPGSGSEVRTDLGPIPAGFRDVRIERVPGSGTDVIRYVIDGTVVAEHSVAPMAGSLHVYLSHNGGAAPMLAVDRVTALVPYLSAGQFDSCPFDAGQPTHWGALEWSAVVPGSSALVVRTRTSDDATTWSTWSAPLPQSGTAVPSPAGRYLQYRLELSSSNSIVSPVVDGVSVSNAGMPALSLAASSVTEGHQGVATMAFPLSLSTASPLQVTVQYTLSNGTATAPQDYTAATGTLTFAPGTTLQTLLVSVIGDRLDEADETFTVTLSNPVNATLANASAVGTILDDDASPVAIDDTVQTIVNQSIVVEVLGNDSDPDGDSLSIAAVTAGALGVATINPTATALVYTPAPGQCGIDTLSYTVTDGNGNSASAVLTVRIGCAGESRTLTTVSDFACGGVNGTVITGDGGGAVALAGLFSDDFQTSTLDSQWVSGAWSGGAYTPAPAAGVLSISNAGGAFVRSAQPVLLTTLEARARFGAAPWQHIGAADLNFEGKYFIFSTFNGSSNLYARSEGGSGETRTDLGPIPSGYHVYRIERVPQAATDLLRYSIDGTVVAEHTVAPAGDPRHLYVSHNGGTATTLDVESLSIGPPHRLSGSFDSCPIDAGSSVNWSTISGQVTVPAPTQLRARTRTSDDAVTWSAWSAPVAIAGGAIGSPAGRYLQVRLELTTSDAGVTPVVQSVTVTNAAGAP